MNPYRWVAPIEDHGVQVAVDVDRAIHPIATQCRAIETEPDTLAVVGTRGLGWDQRPHARPGPHPTGAPHQRRRRDGPQDSQMREANRDVAAL
jgi:hypothetical protein